MVGHRGLVEAEPVLAGADEGVVGTCDVGEDLVVADGVERGRGVGGVGVPERLDGGSAPGGVGLVPHLEVAPDEHVEGLSVEVGGTARTGGLGHASRVAASATGVDDV